MRPKWRQCWVFLIAAAACRPSTGVAQARPEPTRAEAFSIQEKALQIVLDTIDIRPAEQELPVLWLLPWVSDDLDPDVVLSRREVDRLREIAPTLRLAPRSREDLLVCPDEQRVDAPLSGCQIEEDGVIVSITYPRTAAVIDRGGVPTFGAEIVVHGSVTQTSADGDRMDVTGITMGFRKQADEWVFLGVLAWVVS